MREKEIKLLQNQINKTDTKDFNLNAWKNSTILILQRIFGENSPKIKKIEEIHYDLSSWSMRDTLGSSGLDACKRMGKEILEACIIELETLGLPGQTEKEIAATTIDINIILKALENELKIAQFKELKQILEIKKEENKMQKIHDFLIGIGAETSVQILSNILSSQDVASKIQST
jgi:hypothetical protein